ncbi:MAG TPA: acyl-CoA dehydrogenase [Sphingomonadales bacterium]|nr:acyl-CoA dehydrogenase [Sphingomonadales bacterium]
MSYEKPSWADEDHLAIQETAQKFFAAELSPNMDNWRKAGLVDRAFWHKAGETGLIGASVPEQYGGIGGPMSFDAMIMLEHARTGDSGWGVYIQNIVIHYILAYGSEKQKKDWLPRLVSGEMIGAIAMTEPGAGSDLQGVRTQAVKQGDHYVLNGSKTFISNGQNANLICVVAKTDRSKAAHGISLIMLETDGADGFRRGRNLEKLGQKAADTSELFFEDVIIPADHLLGESEGQGFAQLMTQLPWERLLCGIYAVGACDLALRETLTYVSERKAFGRRIMDLQNTRFKLAECKTILEVTRTFIDRCIEKIDQGALDAATASMAKYWGSEMHCKVMDECLQLFGGYGYMLEYPIAHLYADARVQRIYGGTSEIMKELIARSLEVP